MQTIPEAVTDNIATARARTSSGRCGADSPSDQVPLQSVQQVAQAEQRADDPDAQPVDEMMTRWPMRALIAKQFQKADAITLKDYRH